jgi:hypothetical protein
VYIIQAASGFVVLLARGKVAGIYCLVKFQFVLKVKMHVSRCIVVTMIVGIPCIPAYIMDKCPINDVSHCVSPAILSHLSQ